ncbi:MAG: hypothetical protein AAGC60_12025 [Acidobacteriota bacterium]
MHSTVRPSTARSTTTRRIPRAAIAACLLLVGSSVPAVGAAEGAATDAESTWTERTVDVFVDTAPRPDARVLRLDDDELERLVIVLPEAPHAWLIDEASGTASTVSAERWTLSRGEDGNLVASTASVLDPGRDGEPITPAQRAAGGWLVHGGDATLLVAPHDEPIGPLGVDALWLRMPSWHERSTTVPVDPAVVDALASIDEPARLVIYFGTWCGDSRRGVPPLLEAVRRAQERGAPLDIELVALSGGFDEPLEPIRRRALTNVPTVIVEQRGGEIGRVVETPRGASLEADVVSILAGDPPPADERFRAEDRRVARGLYRVVDAEGRDIGNESFVLFTTEDGGRRLHATSRHGLRRLELWQTLDARGVTTFAEITESHGDEHARSRLSRRDDTLRAWVRGDSTGIVRHRLALPARAAFSLPSLASRGLVLSRPSSEPVRPVLAVTGTAPGRLEQLVVSASEVIPFDYDGRRVPSPRFAVTRAGGTETFWLHPRLGVPLRVELATGAVAELIELEQTEE